MNIQFALGVIAAIGSFMMLQDWYGLEGYIQHLRDNWIDLPWWVGLSITIAAASFSIAKEN